MKEVNHIVISKREDEIYEDLRMSRIIIREWVSIEIDPRELKRKYADIEIDPKKIKKAAL